jgi:hypothetical protein
MFMKIHFQKYFYSIETPTESTLIKYIIKNTIRSTNIYNIQQVISDPTVKNYTKKNQDKYKNQFAIRYFIL